MRSFLVLSGLIAIAIILEGCGGSSKACENTKFQLVSQSFDATSTSSVKVTSPSPVNQAMDMDMKEKIDIDKVNYYMAVQTDVDVPNPKGGTIKVHLDEKMIFNAEKKVAVMKMDMSGAVNMSKCTKISFPTLPSPAAISAKIKTLVTAALAKTFSCTGNDGTYDEWSMALTLPDSSVPIPANLINGNMKETLKMDKTFVLHSATMTSSMNMSIPVPGPNGTSNITTVSETEEMSMTTSNARLGGPSIDDLDYSSWGDCKEVHPPNTTMDLHQLLSESLESALKQSVLPRMLSKSVFYRHIAQAIQDSPDVETTDFVMV